MTQKPCLLGQVTVINVVLNQENLLLTSNPYCAFKICHMCLFSQPSIVYVVLNPVILVLALSPYDSSQKNQKSIFYVYLL